MAEIDHKYTDRIVCPHCGGSMEDEEWEVEEGRPKEWDCWHCEKPFSVWSHISVSYTTEAIRATADTAAPAAPRGGE